MRVLAHSQSTCIKGAHIDRRRSRTDCDARIHEELMPNIASILKGEISRVARKELRAETTALKKAASRYRSEIAALKRRTQALEQLLRQLSKTTPKVKAAPTDEDEAPGKFRFSAKGLASQRKRLGLSAEACGMLVGASGQSIYNWESLKHIP